MFNIFINIAVFACMGLVIFSKIFTLLFYSFLQVFPPVPKTLVNDYTQTLNSSEVATLEDMLVRFEDTTSNQIAIVILPNIGDYDISDYAYQLGRNWGVGTKKNNGVLILMSKEDKKVYIASGYGLEGDIPDILVKQIIENEFIPYAKENAYFDAFYHTAEAIMLATQNAYKKENTEKQEKGPAGFFLLLFFIFLIIFFISRRKRGGGNGGGLLSYAPLFLGSHQRSHFRGSGFGSSGGFGGFGGGSFGGGGAGGSW